jgi:hypothetical protein
MNRTKLLAAVLGVVVIVAVPSALPIPSASSLKDETATLRDTNDAIRQKIELTNTYTADAGFPDKQASAALSVPTGPDLPGLIDELDTAITANGMRWTAGAPQKATDAAASNVWTMTMNIEGPITALPDLIDRLGGLQRLVTVDSVNLQRSQGNDITASVIVRFYALNPEDPIATTEVK